MNAIGSSFLHIRYCDFERSTLLKTCPYSELFCYTFFPHFPAFVVNTERYAVSLRIQSECGKMWKKCGPEQLRIRTLLRSERCSSLSQIFVTIIWLYRWALRKRLTVVTVGSKVNTKPLSVSQIKATKLNNQIIKSNLTWVGIRILFQEYFYKNFINTLYLYFINTL